MVLRSISNKISVQSIASFRNLDYYKLFSWFTYNITSSVVIINSLFTTVFCEISARRNKYCLERSSTWGGLKISRWPLHSRTIFEAYLINFHEFSAVYFHFSLPKLGYFSQSERKAKIFGFKNAMEREIRKCLTFVIRQIASKIFGKIILKPL